MHVSGPEICVRNLFATGLVHIVFETVAHHHIYNKCLVIVLLLLGAITLFEQNFSRKRCHLPDQDGIFAFINRSS